MSGSPGDQVPPDPSEVFVVGADGRRDQALGTPRPPRRTGAVGGRWAAAAVVGVLIFGLGVAVGTHVGDGDAGASAAGADVATYVPDSPATSRAGSTAGTPSTVTGVPASVTAPAKSVTAPSRTPPADSSRSPIAAAPWPTARGACGSRVPLPLLTGVRTLREPTGMRLLAGNNTHSYSIDSGTRGSPLFRLAAGEYVSQLAVDESGVVALISDCRGYPPLRVVRRAPDGSVSTVRAHRAGYQAGTLIPGGRHTWVTLYHAQPDSVAYPDDAVLLHATDGSGTVITLPDGFGPVAGSGDLIVGNWSDPFTTATGPIQLYDVTRRAIVGQLGGANPVYVVDHGYIIWLPGDCSGVCTVHRYRIDGGRESTVTATVSPSIWWQAISPDGTRVAGVRYDEPDAGRRSTGHPGGPTGVVVLDLADRSMTRLPGLELAPKSAPSLAFSADSRWLVVGIDRGRTGRVLLYDRDLDAPLDAGITVPGPVLWTIPLAIVG